MDDDAESDCGRSTNCNSDTVSPNLNYKSTMSPFLQSRKSLFFTSLQK